VVSFLFQDNCITQEKKIDNKQGTKTEYLNGGV
jgi:hypothetical protein